MNPAVLRPARKEDCRTVAELYSISSDGLADYIWSTLAEPGEDLLEVGRKRYEREDSVFSYRNCTVAELDGKVVGMLVAFPEPGSDSEPDDPVLKPYSRLEEPGSYYICGVALFDEYRGHGLGTRFLAQAEQRARELKLARLSLIVFEQNEGAHRLYLRHGYQEIKREPVFPHPLIHCTGDALLMVKPVASAA